MVGPDLLGIAGATAFLLVAISLFAVIDRLLCGAWEALNGSPGWGLVAGMSGWCLGSEAVREGGTPSSPSGTPPDEAERVAVERVRGPGWAPWVPGASRHEMVRVLA